MRVSTDPNDPAYIDDRPRRVWVNDREVIGWIVADEFRRCAITPSGVINGAVLIERLPDDAPEPVVEPQPIPINSLSGIFEYVPDTPKAAEAPAPVEAPAPTYAAPVVKVTPKASAKPKHGKRRR
jgi:hypothetical protein